MVRTREELLRAFGEIIGDRNDETVISFMEDMTDTVDAASTPATDEYKGKYEELLRRFKERFYNADGEGDENKRESDDVEERETTDEDIFKED